MRIDPALRAGGGCRVLWLWLPGLNPIKLVIPKVTMIDVELPWSNSTRLVLLVRIRPRPLTMAMSSSPDLG